MLRALCFLTFMFTAFGCEADRDCPFTDEICVNGSCVNYMSWPDGICDVDRQCENYNANLTCRKGHCKCKDPLDGYVQRSGACRRGGCNTEDDCGPGYKCPNTTKRCELKYFARPLELCYVNSQCSRFDEQSRCEDRICRCIKPFESIQGQRCNMTFQGCDEDADCPYDFPKCFRGRCHLKSTCPNETIYVDNINVFDSRGIGLIACGIVICLLSLYICLEKWAKITCRCNYIPRQPPPSAAEANGGGMPVPAVPQSPGPSDEQMYEAPNPPQTPGPSSLYVPPKRPTTQVMPHVRRPLPTIPEAAGEDHIYDVAADEPPVVAEEKQEVVESKLGQPIAVHPNPIYDPTISTFLETNVADATGEQMELQQISADDIINAPATFV